MLRRFIGIVFPQVTSRAESGTKSEIWIVMLRAPFHRLRTDHSGYPHRRMRFLIRQRPRIKVPIVKMLALVSPRPRPRPPLHDKIVGLFKQLAIVSEIRAVEELLAAGAPP